ncbi:MAG: MoxR family ATPase [Rhodocyclaceae bacterium]|nr:MoxR family ATPase [Rhodocyclaceae bacterium]
MDADELREALQRAGYVSDPALAGTLWFAGRLERPLLVEGEAGVGKTALAHAWAAALQRPLIRLQCYEGLDLQHAAYEWNYAKQLLAIRLSEDGAAPAGLADLFSRDYLLERPLLAALASPRPCVLLIDEIDRADEAFEAFLLETLGEFQLSIPEFGTVRATQPPAVVLTSNGTRELSDALRRRCLYHYLDYPDAARETAIVRQAVPGAAGRLAEQVVDFVQRLRREDLAKSPGIAETLDWLRALAALGEQQLPDDPERLLQSFGCLLKTREDRFQIDAERVRRLAAGARNAASSGV